MRANNCLGEVPLSKRLIAGDVLSLTRAQKSFNKAGTSVAGGFFTTNSIPVVVRAKLNSRLSNDRI